MPTHIERVGSISPQPLDSASATDISLYSAPESSGSTKDETSTRQTSQSRPFILPDGVVLRILWLVDANAFASLCVVNRQWRRQSQKVDLYAHHLSRCPSYALANSVITGPFRRDDLSRLRARFAAEVRRNLFDAYLQPRRTLINLISLHTNSSAAFPTGEAFRFEFSPNARTILALSSSRIYVLDATVDPPVVKRQLKTLRRPLSASVTDDGSLLAVLSSKHQVNIYGLTPSGVQHLQVIVLDNAPKIIAIAHEGTVLAASWEAGIEVFSLAANSLTTDRRAVRSEAVDTLGFSGDGSMLVGSSLSMDEPNAVVISAPFYTENDPDLTPREIHSRMWTTQILFPQISSVCSHVTLLPGHIEGDACWLFAFDHSLMSYRAVRTDDTRAGVAYFRSPPGADRFETPLPTIPPSATACGTLAVAAFEEAAVWIYGVPERLDLSPDMGAVIERENEHRPHIATALTSATGHMEPLMAYSPSNSAYDDLIEDDLLAGKVDWRQSLFVKGKDLPGLTGQTAARWVENGDNTNVQTPKRLLVVAPGGVSLDGDELGDEVMPVDGSRVCLLDFDYGPSPLPDRTITIEVGEEEAELLTEHTGSLATEVAMERKRTIRAIPAVEGSRMILGRSVTSVSPPTASGFEQGFRRGGSVSSPSSPSEQLRSPQAHAAGGLQRAATASGFRHARYPPRPPLGSPQYMDPSDGRVNHFGRPTSEDSWETPPPPYTGGNNPGQSQNPGYSVMSPVQEEAQQQDVRLSTRPVTQPAHQQFRPYRALVAERASAGLDTIMTSHAMPFRSSMNQYQELMMAARSRGPSEGSQDNATEASWNLPSSPGATSSSRSPFISRPNIDGSSRLRPVSHYGIMPSGWEGPGRSISMPLPANDAGFVGEGQQERNGSVMLTSSAAHNLSLTGANLQNRLNHPVPPIPEFSKPSEPIPHESHTQNRQFNRVPVPQPPNGQIYAAAPLVHQTVNANRHIVQTDRPQQAPPINTTLVHRGNLAGGMPPSPPRGAWGAVGIPGSPNFNQARNVPNGFSHSRNTSRGSQTSQMASASAPNLLLAQRPMYGRLDTIDSMNDGIGVGGITNTGRSRSHSLTQPVIGVGAEPSAYHETTTLGPGQVIAKLGKKGKRRKEEVVKKGSRCVVM